MTTRVATPADVSWTLCSFDELDVHRLYELLALRSRVFVLEQDCVYLDLDGRDQHPGSRHVLGYLGGKLCACARSLAIADDDGKNATTRIGRVVVCPEHRRRGLADRMLTMLLQDLDARLGRTAVTLDAQLTAEPLYRRAGFARCSEVFLEDGIEHVTMQRR